MSGWTAFAFNVKSNDDRRECWNDRDKQNKTNLAWRAFSLGQNNISEQVL
jgi:hypothetical protein